MRLGQFQSGPRFGKGAVPDIQLACLNCSRVGSSLRQDSGFGSALGITKSNFGPKFFACLYLSHTLWNTQNSKGIVGR
jgi:hypothetical protein